MNELFFHGLKITLNAENHLKKINLCLIRVEIFFYGIKKTNCLIIILFFFKVIKFFETF